MNMLSTRNLIRAAALAAAVYLVGVVLIWDWTICRVGVPPGHSLRLRYKGPFPFGAAKQAPEGTLVTLDKNGRPSMVGILEAMPGPGRHFYSPLEYEREVVPDIVVEPGKLGVVTSKVGKPLPAGAILAEGPGYRGTWRRVLGPGRYRLNSYAYDVKLVGMADAVADGGPVNSAHGIRRRSNDPTLIPPGYVGVVTNKAPNPAIGESQGIQENVLQPGIYYLNPVEKAIDIISIGYNESTLMVEIGKNTDGTRQRRVDGDSLGSRGSIGGREMAGGGAAPQAEGESTDPAYLPGKGIEFPSNDGFPIHLDYTAIWGILPDQAPDVVRQFGALSDVEQKVVLPQIGSICRLYGSKRGAVDLLVGDKREAFQNDTAEELTRVLQSKNLTLLFGLTRHIYVPSKVREPIQKQNIAVELTLTRDQEQRTARAQADLTEAKAKVTLEERRTKAETTKLVAELAAEGEKKAREIEAKTEKLRAEIDARTAAIEAQVTTAMGEAAAKKVELTNQAEAERFVQYVQALGGADAYNRYVFAEGLNPDLKLGVFYAGPGTFWTDLKGFEQVTLGKMASEGMPGLKPKAAP